MVGEFQFKNRKTKHNLAFLSYLFFRKKLVFSLSLVFVALFSFGFVKIASGAFTPYINYQGKLLDSGGSPVANGDYNMSFRLCADSGCASVLWTENRINANKVSVSSGLFSVPLGELTDLSGLDFNQTLYLELSVGGTGVPAWETLLPRKILGAVPNAFNAQKLDGLATTSFLRSDVTNTSAVITTLTSTNIFGDNASITSVTSTNLFSGIINALSAIFDSLTATLGNITTLVFGDATGNNLAVTDLNVTSTANIKDLNASSSVLINSTSTNFYSSNAVITGGSIATSTISGLNVSNFTTSNISQWINDVGYVTSTSNTENDPIWSVVSTSLTVANFASPNISQWTNDSGYLTSYVETDPIFMAASTSLPYQPIGSYLTVESDPIFMAASTSLPYQPIGSYLTVESDPIWLAASTSYLTTSSAASIYQPIGSYLIAESDPIWSAASSSYLTVADASATYGSFAYNSSTFLTVASATATYLTQATAASTYLTQANAVSTYLAINAASTTLWDTAYLWGDHSSVGYLTTSSNLTVANFASPNISQWTNDAGYLTSYVETDPIFMAASTSLPYQPIGSYLTVESDPIWLAASTSYANLSLANTFTNINSFATTSLGYNSWIGSELGTKSIQFSDYTVPAGYGSSSNINLITASNDVSLLGFANGIGIYGQGGSDASIILGNDSYAYTTLISQNSADNELTIAQVDSGLHSYPFLQMRLTADKIWLDGNTNSNIVLDFDSRGAITIATTTGNMNFTGATGYNFTGSVTTTQLTSGNITTTNLFSGLLNVGTSTKITSRLVISSTTTLPQQWVSAEPKIYGDYLYVVMQSSTSTDRLRIFNINNPENPILINTGYDLNSGNIYGARWIEIDGKYAYIGFEDYGSSTTTLGIYDISDPADIKTVSEGVSPCTWSLRGMKIKNGFMYSACYYPVSQGEESFQIFSLKNLTNPIRVSNDVTGFPGEARGIDIQGKYAYTLSYVVTSTNVFRVIDVSDPVNPVVVGGASINLPPWGRNVIVRGNYAYAIFDAFGPPTDTGVTSTQVFRIIDISSSTNPVVISGDELEFGVSDLSQSGATGISVQGDYVYIADQKGKSLKIIDVSDPYNPFFVDSILIGDVIWGIDVADGYAYIPYITAGIDNTSYLAVVKLPQIKTNSIRVGSIVTGGIQALKDLIVQGFGKFFGLFVGDGGLKVTGDSVLSTTTINGATSTSGLSVGEGIYVDHSSSTQYSIYSSGGLNYFEGNVGIGTTTPAGNLDVVGNTSILGDLRFTEDSGINYIQSGNNRTIDSWQPLHFGKFGSTLTYLSISADGFIGVGTTTPQTKLSVVGTSTFQGDISVSGGLLDSTGNFGTNGQILLSTGTSTLWVSTSTLGFVGGSSQWLDSGSDIYFSVGNVGIGTSTPSSALTIQADNNWLSLNRSDGYFLNVTWEESTIDYPLISGLASSTALLGGDLSAVGLKDRAVIVGDSEPNLSFSNYTGVLSSLATIAFNTDTEIINFTGAKDYDWFDYDTGESQFVRFDAENLQVMVGTTTPYTATTSLTVSGSLYADHIYTSGNSFYMNGTKVIASDETNLSFYADSGQNLKLNSVNGAMQLLSTGSGGINLNSSSSLAVHGSTVDITGTNSLIVQTTGNSHGLTIQTNGNASNIGINANGTNSSVDLYATADISLTAPALTLSGALGLTGGLTVSGATTINNNLTATGTVTFSGLTSGLLWSTNGVISSVATNTLGIISSQWIANGSHIYYGVGNVGIGSSSPSSKLSVGGNAYIGGNLTATGTLAITGTATSTFAGTIAVSGNGTSTFAGGINITSGCFAINGVCVGGGTGTSQWTTVGSDIYYATGKIAVGTSTVSTSTLTVYGGADFIPNFNTLLSSIDIRSGSSGYYAQGVEVVGNYAYVVGANLEGTASNQEFIIFDISDRANPVAVSGINFENIVESIYIRGKYVYLGGNNIHGLSDFVVYDISSSTNPVYVGGITLAAGVDSIDLVGNYAYVTDYTTSGFSGSDVKILDISDPTNIRYLGGHDGLCNGFTNVSAYGDKYMVVSGYTGCDGVGGADQSLIIFDVSDPTNPTPVSGYSSAGSPTGQDLDFYIYKNRIYILSQASSTAEIQILDIKNPLSPVYLGSYDIVGTLSSVPSAIFVSNGYAFISVGNIQGDDLLILDVSDPANIIKIDGVEAGTTRSALTVSNGYLYVVGKPSVYLNIYDIGGIKSVTADIGSLYSQDLSVDSFSSLGIANFLNSVYMSDIRSAEGVLNFNTNRIALNPFNTTAGSTGILSFNELSANGSNYVGLKAPDLLATNTVWTLPVSDGNINSFLTTDGDGNLSWGELAIGATAFLSEVNFISTPDTTQAWANMPLAETEFDGAVYTRKQVNMTNYTQFRLVSNQSVQGHTTAYLQAEYSTDGGSNWSNLEDTITGADLLSDTTGLHYGAWGYIADGAKSDVMIRIVGHSGNGVADPAWRQLSIQFKGYAGSQWAGETGGNISYASGSVSIGTTTAGDYNLRIASSSNWLEMTNGGDVYARFSNLSTNIGNIPLFSSQGDTSDVLGGDVSGIFVKNSMYMLGVDSSPILNFATMDGNNLDASMYMGFDGTNFAFSGGAASYAWLDTDDENIVASITNTGNIYSSALNSNGAVYSNNGILTNVNPSSMSYKSEIVSSTLNIDALLGLQVKSFTWNSNGQADFGLIAEEVRDALPELYMDDGTTKGYRADHLSFYLLQIAQRQDTQLKVLLNDYDNRTTTTVSSTQELVVADAPISNSNNFENLSVNSAATFYGTITVVGEAGFTSKVTFKDDVEIEGKLYLDKDQVGTTILPIGTTSTIVIFDKPFKVIPKVVANLNYSTSSLFVRYAIAEKTSSSFMIIIDSPVAEELSFDWLAIGLRASEDQFRDLINDDTNTTSPESILVIDDASSTPDGDNVSISVPEDIGEPEVLGDGGLVESEVENNEVVDGIDSIETDGEIANNTETTQNDGELDSNNDSVNINVVEDSASESVVPDSMNLGDGESVVDSNTDLVSPIIEAIVSVE